MTDPTVNDLHHFELDDLAERVGRSAGAGLRAELAPDDEPGLARVLVDVVAELARAVTVHGDQDDVAGYTAAPRIGVAVDARRDCRTAFAAGAGSWAHILVEEVAEAVDEAADGDVHDLRAELVQVAAVAVRWIRALDRAANHTTSRRHWHWPGVVDLCDPDLHIHVDSRLTP